MQKNHPYACLVIPKVMLVRFVPICQVFDLQVLHISSCLLICREGITCSLLSDNCFLIQYLHLLFCFIFQTETVVYKFH